MPVSPNPTQKKQDLHASRTKQCVSQKEPDASNRNQEAFSNKRDAFNPSANVFSVNLDPCATFHSSAARYQDVLANDSMGSNELTEAWCKGEEGVGERASIPR